MNIATEVMMVQNTMFDTYLYDRKVPNYNRASRSHFNDGNINI